MSRLTRRKTLVLIDRSHLSWALFSGISLIAGTVSYVAYAWSSPKGPSGGSAMGLLFGVIGTFMMLFAGLLAARKPLRIRRIGSAQFWLKGHLWLGTLCIPFILFHSGFGWGGLLEQIMWYSLAIVAVSGFFGLAIQQFLPRLLWNRTPLETFDAQTPYQCDRMTFIADLRIACLCESPLEVPSAHLGEHFSRLVAGHNSIVNGPGARSEQNSKKLLLLQQVSPPEVRDFFWAMAKYAKSEAKVIRFEGDFPELLATTYAGLKETIVETTPQTGAPLDVQHAPAATPHELQRGVTPASDKSSLPAVSGAARKVSRSDLSEKNAEAAAAEPPKLSPLEMMRKKQAEKAQATAATAASETPVSATNAVEPAAASPQAEATAAEPPKLSPLEMMRKKQAEKAQATAATAASETPVPATNAVESAAASPQAEAAAAEPPKLSPLEMMRKKAIEKAKATGEDAGSPSSNPGTSPVKTVAVKPAAPSSGLPQTLSPKLSTVKDTPAAQVALANRPVATLEKSVQPTVLEKHLLREVYLDLVRPFLAENRSRRSGLKSPLASAVESRRMFHQHQTTLPTTLHPVLEELEEFCEVRRQMELQRQILRWMHWWLMIHVPAAIALLIFLVAHVVMSLRVIPFTI